MPKPRTHKPGETVFGIVMLIFSLFVFWQAYRIAGFSALSSPGAFPLAAAAIMVIAALVIVVRNLRLPTADRQGESTTRAFYRYVTPPVLLIFLAFILGFAVVLDALGFLLATFAFLLLSIAFLHRKGMLNAFWIALLALIVIYVIFRLGFKVVLPEGVVPEREIMAWIEQLFASFGTGSGAAPGAAS